MREFRPAIVLHSVSKKTTEVQLNHRESDVDAGAGPPANKALLTVAAVLLAIPIVGLLWVSTLRRSSRRSRGFPFFIWYQFLWVFLCSACTWAAYRLVLVARPRRPLSTRGAKR